VQPTKGCTPFPRDEVELRESIVCLVLKMADPEMTSCRAAVSAAFLARTANSSEASFP